MFDAIKNLTLRPATTGDLALLQHWDNQLHVIASDPNDDWEWETELNHNPDWRKQLIAELNGRPVGFVQIIDPACEESKYWVTFRMAFVLLISGSEKKVILGKVMERRSCVWPLTAVSKIHP